MTIGIVGSEQAKFTPETERTARALIRSLLRPGDVVVSGECHLGGVDIFAREEAEALDLGFIARPPACHNWAYGYKPRNEAIARLSDLVVCITVRTLPPNYTGMRFNYCYHCETGTHVKSGGCWTVKRAKQMGKDGMVLVV